MEKQRKPIELPSIEELEAEISAKKTAKNKRHVLLRAFISIILLELIAVGLFALRGIVGTWAAVAAGVLLLVLAILCLRSRIRRKRRRSAEQELRDLKE